MHDGTWLHNMQTHPREPNPDRNNIHVKFKHIRPNGTAVEPVLISANIDSMPEGAKRALIEDIRRTTGINVPNSAMSWREFELLVEESVHFALNPNIWRIATQWNRQYYNRENPNNPIPARMDIHIAERRQGGIGVVIDAKHFQIAPLNRNEIDTTENYRRRCRASKALIIASQSTIIPQSVANYSYQLKVDLMQANRNLKSNLRKYFYDIAPHSTDL